MTQYPTKYLLLLTTLAAYALHRNDYLSLPIPNILGALCIALPPLAGVALETTLSLIATANNTSTPKLHALTTNNNNNNRSRISPARATQIQVDPSLVTDPQRFRAFQEAQNQLSGALGRLLATVERYPDLKANANFLALQSQLEGTENRIAVERMRYSEAVRDYNTRLRLFPGSLVASLRGFKEKAYFEATPGSQEPPKVKF